MKKKKQTVIKFLVIGEILVIIVMRLQGTFLLRASSLYHELSQMCMLTWPRWDCLQVMYNTLGECHMQQSKCLIIYRDSSAVDKGKNTFIFSFISLAETVNRLRTGGNWSTWRNLLIMSS